MSPSPAPTRRSQAGLVSGTGLPRDIASSQPGQAVLGVWMRLGEAGALVWRTDECGEVEVATDGERLWVWPGASKLGRVSG